MTAGACGLTLHFYSPPASSMRVFDLQRAEMLELVGNYGAWIPQGDHRRVPFAQIAPKRQAKQVIWVAHTTHYRGGRADSAVAANTRLVELAVAIPTPKWSSRPCPQGRLRRRAGRVRQLGPAAEPTASDQPCRACTDRCSVRRTGPSSSRRTNGRKWQSLSQPMRERISTPAGRRAGSRPSSPTRSGCSRSATTTTPPCPPAKTGSRGRAATRRRGRICI